MSMDVIPSSGAFMPPEFWFVLAVLFGTSFISLLIWIVNRFLVRLEVTIDRLEKRIDQHDRDIDIMAHALKLNIKKK